MKPSLAPAPGRIGYIDGLRALAVLAVVVSHATLFSNLSANTTAAYFLQHCAHGVDLFFVLSGFCLAYPTLAKLHESGSTSFDVAGFATRRLVRIVPPFWIAIGIISAGYFVTGSHLDISSIARQAFFLDAKGWYLSRSFWTLPVEFRWYVMFPILLFVWVRSPRAFLAIGVATILASATRISSIDLMMLPAFMLGIVAAHIAVERHPVGRFALTAFAVLVPVSIATMPGSDLGNRYSLFWILASFALVVAAGRIPSLARILSMRWLVAIGVASYSIYLIHEPAMAFLQARGVSPWLSGLAGVGLGFAFWWTFERLFVQGKVRDRLVAEFDAFLPRWFSFMGIGVKIALKSSHHLSRLLHPSMPQLNAQQFGAIRQKDATNGYRRAPTRSGPF